MNQINCSMATLRTIAKTLSCSIPRPAEPDTSDLRVFKSFALPLMSKDEKGESKEVHAVFLREAGADRSKLHVSPPFWEKLCNEVNNNHGKVQG
jgi:hypothetical protein